MATLRLAGIENLEALAEPAADFLRRYPLVETEDASSPPLTETEIEWLTEGGLLMSADEDGDRHAIRQSVTAAIGAYAALVAGAWTGREVAELLGVVPGRIRQRVTERSLYAIEGPKGRVFPRFQFEGAGTLPALREVLQRIPSSAHPVAVERFFRIPTEDLRPDGTSGAMSPRQWLLAGYPVGPVAVLATAL